DRLGALAARGRRAQRREWSRRDRARRCPAAAARRPVRGGGARRGGGGAGRATRALRGVGERRRCRRGADARAADRGPGAAAAPRAPVVVLRALAVRALLVPLLRRPGGRAAAC